MGRPSKWNESYIGKKYGYLTIIGLSPNKSVSGDVRVICKCQCGKIVEPNFYYLRKRNQKSCGCERDHQITHNQSNTKLYRTWTNIKFRCNNPDHISYKYYGGRGIKICPEWDDFLIFRFQMRKKLFDAKKKYKNELLTIERINNNKGYYYENCIFIPRKLQNKHRRSVYPVKAVNRKTGEEVYAKTQRELAKKIKLSVPFVNYVILKKSRSKEWIINPQ